MRETIIRAVARITKELSALMELAAEPQGQTPAPIPAPSHDRPLGAALARILAGISSEPQTARRIAAKIGRKHSSYFDAQLRELCRRRLVERLPGGGYVLRDQAESAGQD